MMSGYMEATQPSGPNRPSPFMSIGVIAMDLVGESKKETPKEGRLTGSVVETEAISSERENSQLFGVRGLLLASDPGLHKIVPTQIADEETGHIPGLTAIERRKIRFYPEGNLESFREKRMMSAHTSSLTTHVAPPLDSSIPDAPNASTTLLKTSLDHTLCHDDFVTFILVLLSVFLACRTF
ncbi:hypothetical protein HAX54_007872 [Datura stramonium]|uniref:Uncharacterized protein n=1 Tax=Datura stramonium TaxID=4076 RepID=A0ABS8WXF2_DATST|nr:hypothetical protein [Datura stramonium]